jgi:hypothetical protein
MSCREEVVELLNRMSLQTLLIELIEKSTKVKAQKSGQNQKQV